MTNDITVLLLLCGCFFLVLGVGGLIADWRLGPDPDLDPDDIRKRQSHP